MRSVLSKQAALFQRFHHQGDVALFQVAHATVHQLGAAARGAFAEVVLFHEEHVVAAARGIDRDANACGAAADNDDVPRIVPFLEANEHLGSAHPTALPVSRTTSGPATRSIVKACRWMAIR